MTGVWVMWLDRVGEEEPLAVDYHFNIEGDEEFMQHATSMEGIQVAYVVDRLVHSRMITGDKIIVQCELEE